MLNEVRHKVAPRVRQLVVAQLQFLARNQGILSAS
jgi:hypothetical protein